MPKWFDDAEDDLCRQVNAGEITQAEYQSEMQELCRSLREMAQEEADMAYDLAMNR